MALVAVTGAVSFGEADFAGAFNARSVAHYSPQCKVGEHV